MTTKNATTHSAANAKTTPKSKPAATPKADPAVGLCRGKWSACGGVNPSRSADWHICQECTDKRSAAMKASKAAPATTATAPQKAKAAPKAAAASKVTPVHPTTRRPAPRPKAEPVQRVPVAAMATPTVTPVTSSND